MAGLFLQFFKEADIGESHLFEPPEVKKVDQYRDGQCQKGPKKYRIQKLHRHYNAVVQDLLNNSEANLAVYG
jgi:hypothetical protein